MKELYFADQSRYDNGMEYERCGRALASGIISEVLTPMSAVVRSPIMPLIMVSPTSTWPTTTDLCMVLLKKRWAD